MNPRDELSESDARLFLAWPEGHELPARDLLVAEARAIIKTNAALDRELAPSGVLVSPVWEERGGQAHARLAALPREFRSRYFDDDARATLLERDALVLVADFTRVFSNDPVGATFALENTLTTWLDEDAPTRVVLQSYRGHLKLLTLLLADVARKASAGFDTLELAASWGCLSMVHDPETDPPVDSIKSAMRAKTTAMWAAEDGWKAAALTRGSL
jgi:hypothetical protein